MTPNRGFDEVMIVNPYDPGAKEGARLMRFHYAQAPNVAGYGAPQYGYFAEDPYGYAEDPYGAYAEDPYGYAEEPFGYAEDPYGAYGAYGEYEPVGYFAEEYPVGAYGEDPYGYAQGPEMVGWGEYEPVGEEPAYAEAPEFAGYVRAGRPRQNPGCAMPTNVAGVDEGVPLEGYTRPAPVGPMVNQFTPPPTQSAAVPETFKPLW
jgi:hypothetical protein